MTSHRAQGFSVCTHKTPMSSEFNGSDFEIYKATSAEKWILSILYIELLNKWKGSSGGFQEASLEVIINTYFAISVKPVGAGDGRGGVEGAKEKKRWRWSVNGFKFSGVCDESCGGLHLLKGLIKSFNGVQTSRSWEEHQPPASGHHTNGPSRHTTGWKENIQKYTKVRLEAEQERGGVEPGKLTEESKHRTKSTKLGEN